MPTCTKCHTEKPEDQFAFASKATGKRHKRCKTCMCDVAKGYYQKFREKNIAYAKSRRGPRKAMLQAWVNTLKDKPCMDCGGNFPPWCMDFDHRPGETKIIFGGVSVMYAQHNFGKAKILEEIAKCDLVCANCHRTRTHQRRLERKQAK